MTRILSLAVRLSLMIISTDELLSMLGPGAMLRHDPHRPPGEPQWTAAWSVPARTALSGGGRMYNQGQGDGHTPREALIDAVRRRWGIR